MWALILIHRSSGSGSNPFPRPRPDLRCEPCFTADFVCNSISPQPAPVENCAYSFNKQNASDVLQLGASL